MGHPATLPCCSVGGLNAKACSDRREVTGKVCGAGSLAGSRVGGILQGRIWRNSREKQLQAVNELVTSR